MVEVLTVGEILVEIMRSKVGTSLNSTDLFKGPFPSGAPAIFIDTVSKLGHKAAIVGGLGDDEFGEACISRLQKDGVDISGINISKSPTGVAFVSYFKDGNRKFIFHIRNSAACKVGELEKKVIASVKIFHIMGCSLMINEDFANKIIEYAVKIKKYGGKISLDPNIRAELMNENYIKKSIDKIKEISDIILPGLEELFLLTKVDEKEKAISRILKNTEILVLKLGSKGCEIYAKDLDSPINISSFKIDEVDPTGAGDSFDAGFLCAHLEGKSLKDCGILANACGALNATKFGPMEGVFNRMAVEDFISKNKVNIH